MAPSMPRIASRAPAPTAASCPACASSGSRSGRAGQSFGGAQQGRRWHRTPRPRQSRPHPGGQRPDVGLEHHRSHGRPAPRSPAAPGRKGQVVVGQDISGRGDPLAACHLPVPVQRRAEQGGSPCPQAAGRRAASPRGRPPRWRRCGTRPRSCAADPSFVPAPIRSALCPVGHDTPAPCARSSASLISALSARAARGAPAAACPAARQRHLSPAAVSCRAIS